MRIAMVGNFSSPYTTENDLLKSLRILGHEVFTFQEDGAPALKGFVFDMALWCHTHSWDRVPWKIIMAPMLYGRGGKRGPMVAFTLDLFRGLKRHDENYVRTHPWFTCDYFFQPDEPDFLKSQGVNAFFSAPAILETSAYAAAPDPLHPAYGKIIFVGSEAYHPEWPWRQEMLAFLKAEYGDRFIHYDHSSGMRGHALNVLYASAAVVVGDSAFANPGSRYSSDRLTESVGRGANLVYPWIKYEFDPWSYLYMYHAGDTGDLRRAISDALEMGTSADSRTKQIELILGGHTYTHRLAKILEVVKG